ncbi:hypothetical protein K1T71_008970 [Dendrolimus kikuchii]|uniref:Uncharacterized protein n=1 Tax=Dendrolimus kikuchii TaxID=765133 RepID=A0ACC1CW34_9NEOP|nr:hypothetical protein K1T71_008970 [Dendrolimus kikuchii]
MLKNLKTSIYLMIPKHHKADNQWDLLIFTQSWPPTVCKVWSDKPNHSCNLPSPEHWSIHGIWPTKLGTMGPSFCNKTWLFDPEQVRPIENTLEDMWINVEKETSLYSLWAHEWSKHGTCAAQLEQLNSEFKYFSKGLEFINDYTMTNILNEAGITPSDNKEYKITDFHNAINSKLGVNPAIECRKSKGKQYIVELRICFKKDLTITDCDGIVREVSVGNLRILSNCDTSKGIIYEYNAKPPQRILLQLYRLTNLIQWLTL